MKLRLTAVALCAAATLMQGVTPAVGQVPDSLAPPPDSTARPAQKRPGLGSWTTDRRDFQVGDIVTILVDELTIASADKANTDASGRSTTGNVGGTMTMPGGVNRGDVLFRSRLDNESNVRGQARRRDVLTTELSARIVEVDPSGLLRLQGSRSLHIDKAIQKVTLAGYVRPQDITARNFVESWRLADAELIYESSGDLGKPKRSILSRIIGVLWP